MTEKLSVKLHAQVRVVIYEIITADREILTYGKATRNNCAKYLLNFSNYYWFTSVVRELRAKRFEILVKYLHSECN